MRSQALGKDHQTLGGTYEWTRLSCPRINWVGRPEKNSVVLPSIFRPVNWHVPLLKAYLSAISHPFLHGNLKKHLLLLRLSLLVSVKRDVHVPCPLRTSKLILSCVYVSLCSTITCYRVLPMCLQIKYQTISCLPYVSLSLSSLYPLVDKIQQTKAPRKS